jgi:hypothetical protein
MPQATDELRSLMAKWFGDPIDEYGPVMFLKSRGFTLTDDAEWVPPVPAHTISDDEGSCIWFLVEEWDFGALHDSWCGRYSLYSVPPCERPYSASHLHPRFPSGDCVACGALCTQGCKHPNAEPEREP